MAVDAVIFHWVTVVATSKAGMGGLGLTSIDLTAYFYANDGIVTLTQPERVQRAFDVLAGFFGWVGLQKNTVKTVGMV